MVATEPFTVAVPVVWFAVLQEARSRPQPANELSVMTYVPNSVIPEKTFVFAEVPSSTKLKLFNGDGVATKEKAVSLSFVACFTIVMEAGTVTALAFKERSILPEEQLSTFEH